MSETLDINLSEFEELLNEGTRLVLERFQDLDMKKASTHFTQKEVESFFDEELPKEGMDHFELLSETNEKVLKPSTNNLGPHMYAYVMAGGTQMSIIAEQLAATVNQNTGKWHLAPTMIEIEKRVVQWSAEMIGYGRDVGGVMVSGGSAANLAGLTVARNLFFERHKVREKGLFGQQPFVVYASKEVHGCVDKSMELLGLGTDNLRKIETHSDCTIDLASFERQIKVDIDAGLNPFCIIGNAGTVNTGAIDDLEALAELSKKYGLWFHVDGAYGGLAASLDTLKDKYKGMERADSVAIDYHKWLYQPFEAGCLLVRNWDTLRSAYYKNAAYLDTTLEGDKGRLDFNEHYFQLSRSAKALKVWMSFKAYGMDKLKRMIQKDIDLTQYLVELINDSEDFRLCASSDLAIACFQYTGGLSDNEEIVRLNKKMISAIEEDSRVFITGTTLEGEFMLRACVINHRKNKRSIDYLVKVIREVGKWELDKMQTVHE